MSSENFEEERKIICVFFHFASSFSLPLHGYNNFRKAFNIAFKTCDFLTADLFDLWLVFDERLRICTLIPRVYSNCSCTLYIVNLKIVDFLSVCVCNLRKSAI